MSSNELPSMSWENGARDSKDTSVDWKENDGDWKESGGDWKESGGDWKENRNDATSSGSHDVEPGIAAGDGDENCRNCDQAGHFARECPEPRKLTGECFNCGEVGHNKSDCPNPRVDRPFTGTCRLCNEEGHRASECPTAPPVQCRNCLKEGHKRTECTESRALNRSAVVDMSADEAWDLLQKASKEHDIDDFKTAFHVYCKASPGATLEELEKQFRTAEFSVFLVAMEKEVQKSMTLVNLQGKEDCKYAVGFEFGLKPRRKKFAGGWPKDPEENMERLKDAGFPMDHKLPVCRNCNELGHTSKFCRGEKVESVERVTVACSNCKELGHRMRDCDKERFDPNMCKNCKQPGHKSSECTELRSAEGVKCKCCNEMGHFAKDCPTNQGGGSGCRNCGEGGHHSHDCDKPNNLALLTCRNCDQTGHFSRDCTEPKDWSRVKCSNCGGMGHTIKRCTQPVPETDGTGGDAGYGRDHGASGGETVGAIDSWNTGGGPAINVAGGWSGGEEVNSGAW